MNSTEQHLNHVFHVDLTDKFEGEDYWLHVAGKKYPLTAHTAETLSAARKTTPKLAHIEGGGITHFSDPVPFPLGTVTRISVRHTNSTGKVPGDHGVAFAAMHVVHDHDENRKLASAKATITSPHTIDYISTAKTLIQHHADLFTANPAMAELVMLHMDSIAAPKTFNLINTLAIKMRKAGPPTAKTGWANYVDFKIEDDGKGGPPRTKQTLVPTEDTMKNAGYAMTAVQKSTKNDLALQGVCWTKQTGQSVQQANTEGKHLTSGPVHRVSKAMPQLVANVSASPQTDDNWTAAIKTTGEADGMQISMTVTDHVNKKVSITVHNTYVRWLGMYIQFVRADKSTMDLTGITVPDDGGIAAEVADTLKLNYSDLKFIGWVGPINTVMAIPVADDPGELVVNITFPPGAVSANIYGCGLGTGDNPYPKTPVIGGVLTAFTNLAIPVFLIGFGVAGQTYKRLYEVMSNKTVIIGASLAVTALFGADLGVQGGVNKKMDWHAFSSFSQLLFSKAGNKALIWCEEQITLGEMEDEIPFAGWIMLAINIATSVVQIAETIVEVATSPWRIPNSISTTITSKVTIYPDPRHKAFPTPPGGYSPSYVVKMIYKDENRPTVKIGPVALNPTQYPSEIQVQFTNTLGGNVKFEVDFYFGNYRAASASSSWIENDERTKLNALYLCELPIPLDKNSVYKHTQILGYKDGAYKWIAQTTPPVATIANESNEQSGNAIGNWTGLALSQRYGRIGLSFEAAGTGVTNCSSGTQGQLYVFQDVSIPGQSPVLSNLSVCGFTDRSHLVYDIFPAKFREVDGNFVIDPITNKPEPDPNDVSLGNYYLDTRKKDADSEQGGGYHLRKVHLDGSVSPLFGLRTGENSYGRFPYYPDAIAMHPSGHVIGVCSQYCKMMITSLAADPGIADNDIPFALTFGGEALNYNGSNGRPGLMFTPVSVTCTYDGTIMVLEQLFSSTDNIARVQAFDLNGNPVSVFTDSTGAPAPVLPLPLTLAGISGGIRYTDMAAVGNGDSAYLYLLGCAGEGRDASQYYMWLYHLGNNIAGGNLLATTPGVSAAKINVDMWHTMYTLNFQMTQDGDGHNAGPNTGSGVGPAGVTVPSVSAWLPPLPVGS